MTEQKTTTNEGVPSDSSAEHENRCSFGCKSDNPCWREATVARWDFHRTDMMVCEEHRRALDLGGGG